MTTMPLSILERMLSDIKLAEITQENIEKDKKVMEDKKEECNTNGENTLTQNQTTGKKSKKSTKKTTNTKK